MEQSFLPAKSSSLKVTNPRFCINITNKCVLKPECHKGSNFPPFIQSKCGKIRTRDTPNMDTLQAVSVEHDTLDHYQTDALHVLQYIANLERFHVIYPVG